MSAPRAAVADTAAVRPWALAASIATATIGGEVWPYIDTRAEGPALVMLPGSVGTCEMFFKQIEALGRRLRIISVSYPALSDPSHLADGLAGLMDHLRIARASVLGSSFGGYWAQFFALRHADRLEHLFLGNIFLTPEELFSNPLFDPAFIATTSAPDLQATWRRRVEQAPDSELKTIQLAMLGGRQSADNLKARFVGVAAATPCPPLAMPRERITVIDCDDDPIIPPRSRQAVRNHYAGAHLHTLTTGGHYPHILNPQAYDAVIEARLFN